MLRRSGRLGFLLALALACAFGAVAGCSQQGEGERCDRSANNDADCDDGLVCVDKAELPGATADRCCPPDGAPVGDARCIRGTNNTGAGGTSSSGGASSSGGTSSGGTMSEAGAPSSEAGTGGAP